MQKLFSDKSGTPAKNSTPAAFNPSTNLPTSTISHHHFTCAVRHISRYVKSTTPNTSFLLRMCFSPFMFRAKQSDYTLPNSFDHIPRPLSVRRYFCNRERGLSGIVYSIIPSESISLILNLSLPESECCPMSTASSALLNSPLAKLDNILSSTDLGPDLGPRWIRGAQRVPIGGVEVVE